jgi:YD repeat-containing protein
MRSLPQPYLIAKKFALKKLKYKLILKSNSIVFLATVFLASFYSISTYAQNYHYWKLENDWQEPYPKVANPQEICQYYFPTIGANIFGAGHSTYDGSLDRYFSSPNVPGGTRFDCYMKIVPANYSSYDIYQWALVYYITGDCPEDTSFEYSTGYCRANSQKGVSDESQLCSGSSNPSAVRGDPVNAANGNNYQVEVDEVIGSRNPITIKRFYNSIDGIWRHSYSDFLTFGDNTLNVVREDGKESIYVLSGGVYRSNTDKGILSSSATGWSYQSIDNKTYYFSLTGKLQKLINADGSQLNIDQKGQTIVVSNSDGLQASMTEDVSHQLSTLTSPFSKFNYLINMGRVEQVEKTVGGITSIRKYLYKDDSYFKNLLSGIIDERGVLFASWTYEDSTNRKTLTAEHAGGAEKTTFAYNDNSTSVTNELGKQLVFQFQTIHGAKRITAIQGQPSANCPASNSSYTYNDKGQIITKTDAKGYLTTYTYNDRGLETSRTEASGTSQARTTTTEWDPTRFLRTKVVEPIRTTVYTYDAQGRPLGQQILVR